MKNFGRNILFWLVAGTLMFMLLDNYSSSSLKEELTYSEFKQEVKGKKVKSIVYKGDQMTVEVERFNGTKYTTQNPAYISDQALNDSLTEADVEIAFEAIDEFEGEFFDNSDIERKLLLSNKIKPKGKRE